MSSQPPKPPTPSPTPHTPYVSPSPYQTTVSSSDHQEPHHIAEFGEVKTVAIQEHDPHQQEAQPVPHLDRKNKLVLQERGSRLRERLFTGRHLQQYWHNEILYRTPHTRTIGPDELFLDLVIVGGIAALGHELRVSYEGWSQVEKFFLLFAAIYSSWRTTILLWNMWGVVSDLFDKIVIYLIFTMLIFIAVGAHDAFGKEDGFGDGLRPYVAVSSFLATAFPSAIMVFLSAKEPLLKNPNNKVNQLVLMASLNILTVLPYFAAAFVPSDRATRILYWVSFVAQFVPNIVSGTLYKYLHRNRTGITRLAVAIELLVEKYDVLTMIVLGESVLGILFEGGELVTEPGVQLGSLYGAAAAATAMLYSLQTLYVNVDGPIAKGGKHAIRHKANNGIVWGLLHMPYHMCLILFATGLGISMQDIALPPGDSAAEVARALVRESGDSSLAAGVERFGRPERWLFSVGWGASLILSGMISVTHFAGPRAATKTWRLLARSIIAFGLMIGLPFSSLSAEHYVGLHTGVLVFIALVEYVCVQMDRLGFFRSEVDALSSSKDSSAPGRSDGLGDDFDDSDESPTSPNDSGIEVPEGSSGDVITRALRARMCKGHCSRLVAVKNTMRKRTNANNQSAEP